ncbi:hypothetical protein BRAS3843_660090 [Bradyrhizobium sp. STM 3843]|nr:hypothetical protein BRAS3843_660090 [Bradyrhizobium sp. STM 3843]
MNLLKTLDEADRQTFENAPFDISAAPTFGRDSSNSTRITPEGRKGSTRGSKKLGSLPRTGGMAGHGSSLQEREQTHWESQVGRAGAVPSWLMSKRGATRLATRDGQTNRMTLADRKRSRSGCRFKGGFFRRVLSLDLAVVQHAPLVPNRHDRVLSDTHSDLLGLKPSATRATRRSSRDVPDHGCSQFPP